MLVLAALISASTAVVQMIPVKPGQDNIHSRRSKSESPSHPQPADLDRNLILHHDNPAPDSLSEDTLQLAHLAAATPTKAIPDHDDDPDVPPRTDQDDRPVPTIWLMRGYSRLADIPTSSATGTGTHARHTSTLDAIEHCPTSGESPRDWMQRTEFQLVGASAVFFMLVVLVECLGYLWRTACRRARRGKRDGVALPGREKQLRAFCEEVESSA